MPHLYLRNNGKSERYRPRPRGGGNPPLPDRDRQKHAEKLKQAIEEAIVNANQQLNTREPDIAVGEPGFYLEFQIQADKANIFENLANKPKKIELVSVKPSPKSSSEQESFVQATVFVPEKAKEFFLQKIEQYSEEETTLGTLTHSPLSILSSKARFFSSNLRAAINSKKMTVFRAEEFLLNELPT